MPHHTPRWLRRAASAFVALATTASGLALVAVAAPAEASPGSCSFEFTPSTIGPGDSFDLNFTADDATYDVYWLRDGEFVGLYSDEWVAPNGFSGDYDWMTESFGVEETFTLRAFYDASVVDAISTPECEATLTLEPAGEPDPDPAPVCSATFSSPTVSPDETVDLVLTGGGEPDVQYALYLLPSGSDEPLEWNAPQAIPTTQPFSYSILSSLGENVTSVEVLVLRRDAELWAENVLCSDTVDLVAATPDEQSITFDPVATHDLTEFTVSASASSELPVEFASETPEVCEVTTSGDVTPVSTGTCTVVASQPGDEAFAAAAPVSRDITITPYTQEITFEPIDDVEIDAGPVELTAYSSMDLEVAFDSETPDVCTVADDTAVLEAVGTCTIVASQDGEPGVIEPASASQSFEVLEAAAPLEPATLTLTAPEGLPLSAKIGTLKVSSTGEAKIAVASTTPSVCKVSGTTKVKLLKAGTCSVRATQKAGKDHLAAAPVTASFAVWATPSLPKKAQAAEALSVLGKGEEAYTVVATPAKVCRAVDGDVVLVDRGVCTIQVRAGKAVVRTAKVTVTVPDAPAKTDKTMSLGATVYFAFDSAELTAEGKASLRDAAAKLRKAALVVVYGHTYGPGKNSAHSKALAAARARAVVRYLDELGVESRATTRVAMAMQQPVSSTAWKNRRAEVYFR